MTNRTQRNRIITPHGITTCYRVDGDPAPICPPAAPDYRRARAQGAAGWLESATFTPYEPLGFLSATWQVPDPPDEPDKSLVYLFCGAEDARLRAIMQPVLQWGYNGAFGDQESWWIACWHCTTEGQTIVSKKQVAVAPGEVVRGTIRVETPHESSCDWLLEIAVVDEASRRAYLSVPALDQLMLYLAGAALEAYHLPSGKPLAGTTADLPLLPASGSTEFADVVARDLNGNPIRTGWRTAYPPDPRYGVDVSDDHTSITVVY